jgi:hypothetical protein
VYKYTVLTTDLFLAVYTGAGLGNLKKTYSLEGKTISK